MTAPGDVRRQIGGAAYYRHGVGRNAALHLSMDHRCGLDLSKGEFTTADCRGQLPDPVADEAIQPAGVFGFDGSDSTFLFMGSMGGVTCRSYRCVVKDSAGLTVTSDWGDFKVAPVITGQAPPARR